MQPFRGIPVHCRQARVLFEKIGNTRCWNFFFVHEDWYRILCEVKDGWTCGSCFLAKGSLSNVKACSRGNNCFHSAFRVQSTILPDWISSLVSIFRNFTLVRNSEMKSTTLKCFSFLKNWRCKWRFMERVILVTATCLAEKALGIGYYTREKISLVGGEGGMVTLYRNQKVFGEWFFSFSSNARTAFYIKTAKSSFWVF